MCPRNDLAWEEGQTTPFSCTLVLCPHLSSPRFCSPHLHPPLPFVNDIHCPLIAALTSWVVSTYGTQLKQPQLPWVQGDVALKSLRPCMSVAPSGEQRVGHSGTTVIGHARDCTCSCAVQNSGC